MFTPTLQADLTSWAACDMTIIIWYMFTVHFVKTLVGKQKSLCDNKSTIGQ